MLRKSPTVVIAAVLAGLAGAGAYFEVHDAQQQAYKNSTLVTVLTAKGVIPRDESAAQAYAQGLIRQTRMPSQFAPAEALTGLGSLKKDVAAYNVPAGEVLVKDMFVSPESVASVAAQTVPKGDVAISVSVDQVHGVAGLIQPGDKVDILVNLSGDKETYLYQAVPVLAVGTTLVSAPGASAAQTGASSSTQAVNVITFAVPPPAAARIALANSDGGGVTGGIYLTLEAAGNQPGNPPTVTGANLLPSGSGSAGASSASTGSGQSSVSSDSDADAGSGSGASSPALHVDDDRTP